MCLCSGGICVFLMDIYITRTNVKNYNKEEVKRRK